MSSTGMIRTKRAATTLVAVPAAFLLTLAPAQAAGESKVVYTTDTGVVGGKALFTGGTNPEKFQVCDTDADGMAVRAMFWWDGENGGPDGYIRLTDDNGATAFCVGGEFVTNFDVHEGAHVQITVCRVSADREQDCREDWAWA